MKYWLVLILLGALCGCMSPNKLPPIRLHTMDPEVQVAQHPTSALTLGVRPIQAARPYEVVMAVLGEDKLLHYRDLDSWAETPNDFVTRALVDAISKSKRFSDVGDAADMSRPDLILTGQIRKFHENQSVSPRSAELEVRLELREARKKGNLWDATIKKRVPLAGETTDAFADAMEQAIAQAAQDAAEGIANSVP